MGLFGFGKDRKEFRRCREAAQNGDADAQYRCGVMYYDGKGAVTDKKKAKTYLQKVADTVALPVIDMGIYDKVKKALRELF